MSSTVTVSTRVAAEVKTRVDLAAKMQGMDVSGFLRICIESMVNKESTTALALEDGIVEQIEFLRQIVHTCPDWADAESLIKGEVDHLWEKTQNHLQF